MRPERSAVRPSWRKGFGFKLGGSARVATTSVLAGGACCSAGRVPDGEVPQAEMSRPQVAMRMRRCTLITPFLLLDWRLAYQVNALMALVGMDYASSSRMPVTSSV